MWWQSSDGNVSLAPAPSCYTQTCNTGAFWFLFSELTRNAKTKRPPIWPTGFSHRWESQSMSCLRVQEWRQDLNNATVANGFLVLSWSVGRGQTQVWQEGWCWLDWSVRLDRTDQILCPSLDLLVSVPLLPTMSLLSHLLWRSFLSFRFPVPGIVSFCDSHNWWTARYLYL